MRYRLHVSRAELVAAAFPFFDGVRRILEQPNHTYHGIGSLWHIALPYLLLSTPVLICLQYFYGYVELTPSSLEYHAVLGQRSISYPQIERVVCKAQSLGWSNVESTEISGLGMKKLILKLEETKDFIHELKQYAPQARMEVPDLR
jgi:hypothetical protein